MVDRKARVDELRKRVTPGQVDEGDVGDDTDGTDEERARRFVWEPGDIEVISPPVSEDDKKDDEER